MSGYNPYADPVVVNRRAAAACAAPTKAQMHAWLHERWPWCGCGNPREALGLLRDVLDWISWGDLGSVHPNAQKASESHEEYYRRFRARDVELFGTGRDGLRTQYLYLLAHADITEHGGSVPGWVTARGYQVLAGLREHGTDDSDWEPADGHESFDESAWA